jgi:hypothetical protein
MTDDLGNVRLQRLEQLSLLLGEIDLASDRNLNRIL